MELVIVYLLVNILAGAAACFFGKKLFFVMLGALVFLGVFNVALGATDASPVSLVVAAVLGVVAALLSKYAYKAAVFLAGFVAGAALGFVVTMLLADQLGDFLGLVMVIAGVLVGLAGVRWSDMIVRWGTAWTGATFVVPNVLAAALAFGSLSRLRWPSARSRSARCPATPWRPSTRSPASSAASSLPRTARRSWWGRSCSPWRAPSSRPRSTTRGSSRLASDGGLCSRIALRPGDGARFA